MAAYYRPDQRATLRNIMLDCIDLHAAVLQKIHEIEEREKTAKKRERRRAMNQRIVARRRFWVRPWLERRPLLGQYDRLLKELHDEDPLSYKNFLRLEPDMFQEILLRIGPKIQKDTFFRRALDPGMKLAITLRYLATGDSYKSLVYGFRVASNTISILIPEVCEAIIEAYAAEVVDCPTSPE
jgi:hypothetical protein